MNLFLRASRSTQTSVHSKWRIWLLGSALAIGIVQIIKYPAMFHFVLANREHGPDMSDLPAGMAEKALEVGTGLGLTVSWVIGVLALVLVRRFAIARSGAKGRLFPGWLMGPVLIGLTFPDLLTAVTGEVNLVTKPLFCVAYIPLMGVAVWLSARPRNKILRMVDVGLVLLLPFV